MSSESTKPPWMRFEWYSTPPRLTKESIFSCPNVDGGLIGGASLTFEAFDEIAREL